MSKYYLTFFLFVAGAGAASSFVVKVDRDTQKRIDLQVELVAAATHTPAVQGYGRVIDPTALAGQFSEMASAEAAYAASSNDLARVKILQGQGNTSAHNMETAEAAALRDQLALQAARDRFTLSWGRALPTNLIERLISHQALLVRVDLPATTAFPGNPIGARLVSLSGNVLEGKFLGAVTAVDPDMQGAGFLFMAKPTATDFLFGEAVTGYLQFTNAPVLGFDLPRNAVVRSQGAAWVYVKTGDEAFTRVKVDLDQPTAHGWFVTNGISAHDSVVIAPPQLLLSEELKSSMAGEGER